MIWNDEFVALDLASPTLEAELEKQLSDAHVPAGDIDLARALVTQAARLASSHKLTGEGHVEIVRTDAGAMVSLHHGDGAVVAQNIDPIEVEKAKAARLALAAKTVRKVVSPAPKPTSRLP